MILIDPRFGGTDETPRWCELLQDITETERSLLPAGDVSFTGNGPKGTVVVGIEHKTVEDFVSSFLAGRLSKQAEKLSRQYDYRWLLVEGPYRSRRDGIAEIPRGAKWTPIRLGKQTRPIFWNQLEGARLSYEVQAGLRRMHTRTPMETARWIKVTYDWFQKAWHEHTTMKVLYQPEQSFSIMAGEDDTFRRMVACLPGVGWERSQKITEHFTDMWDLTLASEDVLRDLLGKTIGPNVYKALHHAL